jgi:hypothetical protein
MYAVETCMYGEERSNECVPVQSEEEDEQRTRRRRSETCVGEDRETSVPLSSLLLLLPSHVHSISSHSAVQMYTALLLCLSH